MNDNITNQRQFDGRDNFAADDSIESLLNEHFEKFDISKEEICRNFQIYTRRIFLKKFLAHYELFKQVVDLPGDIVELGVYRGTTLMNWANFLEIRNCSIDFIKIAEILRNSGKIPLKFGEKL